MQLINAGEYTQFGRVFGPKINLYIGGIFFLTAIGFWIQSYMVPAPEDDKNDAVKSDDTKKNEDKIGDNKDVTKDEGKTATATTAPAETQPPTEKKEDVKLDEKKDDNLEKKII